MKFWSYFMKIPFLGSPSEYVKRLMCAFCILTYFKHSILTTEDGTWHSGKRGMYFICKCSRDSPSDLNLTVSFLSIISDDDGSLYYCRSFVKSKCRKIQIFLSGNAQRLSVIKQRPRETRNTFFTDPTTFIFYFFS